MPGPYAHLSLVMELEKSKCFDEVLLPLTGLETAGDGLFCYCALGSVSPDYPNLASPESGDSVWADAMHHSHTGEMIVRGVDYLRQMHDKIEKVRCLAWILGYSAHIVADATIHPVVQLKVGDYETNVFAHRLCELHQDYFIAQCLGLGEIGESPYLNGLLHECFHQGSYGLLAFDVTRLWSDLLIDCHHDLFQKQPPDIHAWHRNAIQLSEKGKHEGHHLFPLARVILNNTGLHYPVPDSADPEYLEQLQVPGGKTISYGEIFSRAVENVADAWKIIASGVHGDDNRYRSWFGDWNLDTGRDSDGRLGFW